MTVRLTVAAVAVPSTRDGSTLRQSSSGAGRPRDAGETRATAVADAAVAAAAAALSETSKALAASSDGANEWNATPRLEIGNWTRMLTPLQTGMLPQKGGPVIRLVPAAELQ